MAPALIPLHALLHPPGATPLPPPLLHSLPRRLTPVAHWTMSLYFLLMLQVTIFCTTIYLHRCAAHRSIDLHPIPQHFFRFWAWLSTAMVTREWVAVHRKHHAKCETTEDPHSPRFAGINQVLWRGVELYQESRLDKDMLEKYGKGCPDDWIERNLYTPHGSAGPTLLLFTSIALFGLPGL